MSFAARRYYACIRPNANGLFVTTKRQSKLPQFGGSASGGWTARKVRNLSAALQCLDLSAYSGGFMVVLTFREMPSEAFYRSCKGKLGKWLNNHADGYVWVCEWQKRGVPHFHVALFGVDKALAVNLKTAWLRITSSNGTLAVGQHISVIRDSAGLLAYFVKEVSKTSTHRQRKDGWLPDGWKTAGKLWSRSSNLKWWELVFEITEDEAELIRDAWQYEVLVNRMREAVRDGSLERNGSFPVVELSRSYGLGAWRTGHHPETYALIEQLTHEKKGEKRGNVD